MTLNKKNLFKLSLLALVLALGTACDETEVPEEEKAGTTTTITYKAEQVNKPGAGGAAGVAFGAVAHMAKSLNSSTLYVAEAGALHAIDAAGAPTALTITSDLSLAAAAGTANGNATGVNSIRKLHPSTNGVMVTAGAGAAQNFALHFTGNTPLAASAWQAEQNDSTYMTKIGHANTKILGFVVNKLGTGEIPYVFSEYLLTYSGNVGFGLALSEVAQRDGTPLSAASNHIVSHYASGTAYVVDSALGVSSALPAAVGTAGDIFANITGTNMALSDTAVGSDALQVLNAGGAAGGTLNSAINAVRIVGDKIYIAFAGGVGQGGVAIVNLTAAGAIDSVNAPAHAWANTDVRNLTSNGTDVYAVLDNKIVKVEVAASATVAGADLSAYYGAKKADGTAFAFGTAAGQIGDAVAAEFMGDDLYLGTTVGLYKFTKTTVTK